MNRQSILKKSPITILDINQETKKQRGGQAAIAQWKHQHEKRNSMVAQLGKYQLGVCPLHWEVRFFVRCLSPLAASHCILCPLWLLSCRISSRPRKNERKKKGITGQWTRALSLKTSNAASLNFSRSASVRIG